MTVARVGGSPSLQQVINSLDQRVTALEDYQALPAAVAENFLVTPAPALDGSQISFDLVTTAGVLQVSILRNFSLDLGSAAVLASYAATGLAAGRTVTYSDNDPALAGRVANYWLAVEPLNRSLQPQYLGPQSLSAAAADQVPPDSLIDFDASVSAGGTGATVSVGISFAPPNETRFGGCRVFVAGYKGNAADVSVAQFSSDPDAFPLEKTGELVTLKAVSVNKAGVQAAMGTALVKALTLGAATAPCKVLNATAAAIATGVQITFPSAPETTVTSYSISRGPLGGGFGAASVIGTVAPTGAAGYTYLDTAGLEGQYEWYVRSVNPAGTSAAAAAITTQAVTTSANLPANVPLNNANSATVDSLDAGSSATVRIYGAGGPGSSWTRATGFGAATMPAGTLAGLSYATKYYVLWNGVAYFATTQYQQALGDNNIWAGSVTTVASGGGGGTSGGGGPDLSDSDGHLTPV